MRLLRTLALAAAILGGFFIAADSQTYTPPIAGTGTVVVQRVTNPSFEVSTWQAFGPTGVICTPATGSTTSCLHEADLAAFPYVLGNPNPGYDLEIRGGADPANNGSHYSGAAVLIPMSVAWTLNPMQGGKIIGHGLTMPCNLTIDSLEFAEIDLEGSQVSACAGGDTRNGLVLNPQNPTPFDLITGIGPGRIFVQSVNGGMHITGKMAQNEEIRVSELNVSALFTSGCVYQSDTATGGANLTGDHITINFLHGFGTAGMTAMCVGTGFESGGNVNGFNVYDVGMAASAAVAVNGVDTYGHDDKWIIRASNFGSANYIIKFESGSCRNHADIYIQGTAPSTIVNDSGGCSAANANVWTVNGLTVTGQATISGSTAHGLLIGEGTSPVAATAAGTAGFLAYGAGASTDPIFAQCLPQTSYLTSGTNATYTTPTCTINGQAVLPAAIDIEILGGGAGGQGGGTSPGTGTAGNASCWNTSGTACTSPVYQAGGGSTLAGAGGICTGSGTFSFSGVGGQGGAAVAWTTTTIAVGGSAGSAPVYGVTNFGVAGGAGTNGPPNSGTGGSGGGSTGSTGGGAGGSGGAYCRARITGPASSYVYTVPLASASGGAAGTSGFAGGNGGTGLITARAYWQ